VCVSTCLLLIRGILAALRQKSHLSTCADSPSHLNVATYDAARVVDVHGALWNQGLASTPIP